MNHGAEAHTTSQFRYFEKNIYKDTDVYSQTNK